MSYMIYSTTGRCCLYPAENSQDSCVRRCSGFTVLEILIVVVILAIASVMVVPMMSSASSIQIRSAANIIAADLEYAKSLAISRGQNFSIEFDTGAESYSLLDQDDVVISHPIRKGHNYIIDFRNDSRLDKVNIASVSFADSKVTFDCLGSPDNGGTISLAAGGTTITIRVVPITGYIRIEE